MPGRLAATSFSGNYVDELENFSKDVTFGANGAGNYNRTAKFKARCDPTNLFQLD